MNSNIQRLGQLIDAKRILDQITADLAAAQNHPDDLNSAVLRDFYDRMCANVTDIENFMVNLDLDDVQVCQRCGSPEVAREQWINVNDDTDNPMEGQSGLSWCFGECLNETTIIELRDFQAETE